MIKNYIQDNNDNKIFKIYRLIIFFIKNWLGNNFLNFRPIVDNTLEFRTNNTKERFNYILNNCVKHYHSKLLFFIDKYKSLIISYCNKYINLLYY